jgi:hypothetical protein
MMPRKEEISVDNRREGEKNKHRFCVTNFDLHRFFAKQLSINGNAGRVPLSCEAGEGLGVGVDLEMSVL